VDLQTRPPWSNSAAKKLGDALRTGSVPAAGAPPYDDVMLWHAELATEVHEQIEATTWPVAEGLKPELGRLMDGLLVSSRPKTQDTLVQKLKRQPTLQLSSVQDLAGVRIDADLYLGEQLELAREIARHFDHDEQAIHDLRNGDHAGYRGVHVWLRLPAGRVEVQIRTGMQSLWANLYEKAADQYGREIRYGEPVDETRADAGEIHQIVGVMGKLADMMAEQETELQQIVEMDDVGQRGMMLGATNMGRAMFFAFVYLLLKGDIDPANWQIPTGGS
jgi:ppGpp synthetase/RelA/SpoT-type nucleotidyltranferase